MLTDTIERPIKGVKIPPAPLAVQIGNPAIDD
jgi:hypothetical protein